MVNLYSADAVRYTLLSLAPEGQDIRIGEKDFEIGRNFTNKIWNAYRFISSKIDDRDLPELNYNELELADEWIISRYNYAVASISDDIENFKVSSALDNAYKFFWGEYCDWYLELIKERLYSDDEVRVNSALSVAVHVFKGTMQLLHPFVPFVTEEVYTELSGEKSIMLSSMPISDESRINRAVEDKMSLIQELSTAVRTIRSQMSVPPSVKATLILRSNSKENLEIIEENRSYIENLCKLDSIELNGKSERPKLAATDVVKNIELIMPLEGLIDIELETERLNKALHNVEGALKAVENKLVNKSFVKNAPPAVVEKEKQKKHDFSEKVTKIKTNLKWLTNAS